MAEDTIPDYGANVFVENGKHFGRLIVDLAKLERAFAITQSQ